MIQFGLPDTTLFVEAHGQIIEARGGVRVIWTEDLFGGREHMPIKRLGFPMATLFAKVLSQITEGDDGSRMQFAKY
jgi:hypothetical protein